MIGLLLVFSVFFLTCVTYLRISLRQVDLNLRLNRNRRAGYLRLDRFSVVKEITAVDFERINDSGRVATGHPLH